MEILTTVFCAAMAATFAPWRQLLGWDLIEKYGPLIGAGLHGVAFAWSVWRAPPTSGVGAGVLWLALVGAVLCGFLVARWVQVGAEIAASERAQRLLNEEMLQDG